MSPARPCTLRGAPRSALAFVVLLGGTFGTLAIPRSADAGCPSTAGCPQAAVNGTDPNDAVMKELLEQAARQELGTGGPSYPQISRGNPVTVTEDATMPCVLLQAIGWVESTWTQFCGSGGGPTVISFDCGYGVTQVTSGMGTGSMGALSFSPARVASEAAYNIGTGAGILVIKWLSVPSIGDNQPDVVEHWYYAVWAYNGFAYVNNPNNPNFPGGRPPYGGPGALSRGSYPYQELVWGLAAYPPGNRYDAIPVTYPSSGAIGQSPGDIAAPGLVHMDPCQGGGIIVDDLDPEFTLVHGAAGIQTSVTGGFRDRFLHQGSYSPVGAPLTVGHWAPQIPTTALYALDVYVPTGPNATAAAARYDVAFQGGHAVGNLNQGAWSGEWVELNPGQSYKFAAGQRGYVGLSNLSTGDELALDAVRWRLVGTPGGTGVGGGCSSPNDCAGDAVCFANVCTADCTLTGCPTGTSCEAATGICAAPLGGEGEPLDDGSQFLDTDGDGIPNYLEGFEDSDGDGAPNSFDWDSDNDGIPDGQEGASDSDGDGRPDFLDPDSDGDGIPDALEAGDDAEVPVDSDGDGVPDFLDTDSDGDGLLDADEVGDDPESPLDTDDDGIPDHLDTDSDDDGIPDSEDGLLELPPPGPGTGLLPGTPPADLPDAGCACEASSSPGPSALLLFVGLGWAGRRRPRI